MGFQNLDIPAGSPAARRMHAALSTSAASKAELERLTLGNLSLSGQLAEARNECAGLVSERADLAKQVGELTNTVAVLRAHFSNDDLDLNAPVIFVKTIQRVVADYYRVGVKDMVSDRRPKSICHPRQVAVYLAREMTPRSFPEIGVRFGGRDHTTIIHAWRKVTTMIMDGHPVAKEVADLRPLIRAASAQAKAAAAAA